MKNLTLLWPDHYSSIIRRSEKLCLVHLRCSWRGSFPHCRLWVAIRWARRQLCVWARWPDVMKLDPNRKSPVRVDWGCHVPPFCCESNNVGIAGNLWQYLWVSIVGKALFPRRFFGVMLMLDGNAEFLTRGSRSQPEARPRFLWTQSQRHSESIGNGSSLQAYRYSTRLQVP